MASSVGSAVSSPSTDANSSDGSFPSVVWLATTPDTAISYSSDLQADALRRLARIPGITADLASAPTNRVRGIYLNDLVYSDALGEQYLAYISEHPEVIALRAQGDARSSPDYRTSLENAVDPRAFQRGQHAFFHGWNWARPVNGMPVRRYEPNVGPMGETIEFDSQMSLPTLHRADVHSDAPKAAATSPARIRGQEQGSRVRSLGKARGCFVQVLAHFRKSKRRDSSATSMLASSVLQVLRETPLS
ncbi:hypothetical protein LTR08_005096 [Meristemomyces frigidus]|nr:hypothetical protein LTR08_005096 [Meristemomyces frigidus]